MPLKVPITNTLSKGMMFQTWRSSNWPFGRLSRTPPALMNTKSAPVSSRSAFSIRVLISRGVNSLGNRQGAVDHGLHLRLPVVHQGGDIGGGRDLGGIHGDALPFPIGQLVRGSIDLKIEAAKLDAVTFHAHQHASIVRARLGEAGVEVARDGNLNFGNQLQDRLLFVAVDVRQQHNQVGLAAQLSGA